jgi:hypothetical protein
VGLFIGCFEGHLLGKLAGWLVGINDSLLIV